MGGGGRYHDQRGVQVEPRACSTELEFQVKLQAKQPSRGGTESFSAQPKAEPGQRQVNVPPLWNASYGRIVAWVDCRAKRIWQHQPQTGHCMARQGTAPPAPLPFCKAIYHNSSPAPARSQPRWPRTAALSCCGPVGCFLSCHYCFMAFSQKKNQRKVRKGQEHRRQGRGERRLKKSLVATYDSLQPSVWVSECRTGEQS